MILSTTEKYDPYENAVAERINGILKYEFGLSLHCTMQITVALIQHTLFLSFST